MNYTYPQQQYVPSQAPYRQNLYAQTWNSTTQNPQVRPVSSVEEVRASPIDFDGSVFYFPDVAHRKIYTKSINMDGTVSIILYELRELASADQFNDSSYITRQEFEETINQLKSLMMPKEQEISQTAAQPTFQF